MEKILERLKTNETPKAAPTMTAFKAPVPEVNPAFLCDTQSLFYALRSDFVSLTDYAKYVTTFTTCINYIESWTFTPVIASQSSGFSFYVTLC